MEDVFVKFLPCNERKTAVGFLIYLYRYITSLPLLTQGEVLMFAPRRGDSLEEFVAEASGRFTVTVSDDYLPRLSQLHKQVC